MSTNSHAVRVTDALLTRARFAETATELLSAVLDVAEYLDGAVTDENAGEFSSHLLETAKRLEGLVTETAPLNVFSLPAASRAQLLNLAINLVMLVVETRERGGEETDSELELALNCAMRLSPGVDFPQGHQILASVIIHPERPTKRVCNITAARERLRERFHQLHGVMSEIKKNLSAAATIFEEVERILENGRRLYIVAEEGDNLLLRSRAGGHGVRTYTHSRVFLSLGVQFLERLKHDKPDNIVILANQSRRAVLVARLVKAYAEAEVACAFAEYWESCPGYARFGVLAHQAIAHAEVVLYDLWPYYAPLVFLHSTEQIAAESEAHIYSLVKYSRAAYSHAMALHAQMELLPARLRPEFKTELRPRAWFYDECLMPVKWPEIDACGVDIEKDSQVEISAAHVRNTRETLMERSLMRDRPRIRIYPKQRLIGFQTLRGARGGSRKSNG